MFEFIFKKRKKDNFNVKVSLIDNNKYVPIKKIGMYKINENHMVACHII